MWQVFLQLGNAKANSFWGANIPPSESLCMNANNEQRLQHITAKYVHGKYRKYHALYGQQEALNSVSQYMTSFKSSKPYFFFTSFIFMFCLLYFQRLCAKQCSLLIFWRRFHCCIVEQTSSATLVSQNSLLQCLWPNAVVSQSKWSYLHRT